MDEAKTEFIERFGLLFEQDGLPRIAGRVFALLIISERALTLDEIAEILQVSKTSVSTNTRMLDMMGMLERTSRPGDRKAYYRLADDSLEISVERTRQRMQQVLEILSETGDRLGEEGGGAAARVKKMRQWHEFLVDELDTIWERWNAREKYDDE